MLGHRKAKVHPGSASSKTLTPGRKRGKQDEPEYDSDCSSSVHSDNRLTGGTHENKEEDDDDIGLDNMLTSSKDNSMKGSTKLAQQHNIIREKIVQEVISEILPDMGSYANGTFDKHIVKEDSFTVKWLKLLGCMAMDLHDAVLAGSVDELKRTITKLCVGPKATPEMINAYDQEGRTALSLAAKVNHNIMCLELIESNAIVECPDESTGRTPLYYSVQNRNHELSKLLLASGAKANTADFQCVTPLMIACIKDDYKHVKMLCDAHADVDMQDEQGWTALHYAVMNDAQRCLAILLSEGADREIRDLNKRKPLHFARFHEYGNCVAMLEEKGQLTF